MKPQNNYSKNFFDIYSFSHISHGILFYLVFNYLNVDFLTGLYLTIILEFLWEIFENTEFIICLYRKDYGNYEGDSYINMIGDITFTIFGYLLASKSLFGSLIFLISSEIMLIPYKANLLQLSLGSLFKKTNLSLCKKFII